jgi:hypothetical protein
MFEITTDNASTMTSMTEQIEAAKAQHPDLKLSP